MSMRREVLAVYKRALRLANDWGKYALQAEDIATEKEYIQNESKKLFRKNRNISDEEMIKDHIKEAETRIEMAIHYKTPYPRPVNIPQSVLPPLSAKLKKAMTMFFSNTSVKQFLALHLFEVGYLGVLAVLPFLVAKPVVGLSILAILAFLSLSAIWRMLTFRRVPNLETRSVLITGCDTGFGHALAKRMASLGLTVYAGCLNPEGEGAKLLKQATSSENIHIVPLDVTSEQSVMDAVDLVRKKTKDEGLWSLVNNAGISCLMDVEFCSMEMYKNVTDVNLLGTVRVTKACLPLIRKGQGRVINVTSAATCYPYHSAHAMTKAGCDAFSNSLRREMHKFGVRVITVEPGNFYGATALLNKSTMTGLEKEHEQVWEKAKPELKATYGQNYFSGVQQSLSSFAGTSSNSLGPVVDTLEEAIVCTRPGARYLVDGSSLLFDVHNVLLRLGWLLPQQCVDFILEREFSSGPSSVLKTKHSS